MMDACQKLPLIINFSFDLLGLAADEKNANIQVMDAC